MKRISNPSSDQITQYIDQNFNKIQETHTLLDKIEERIKSFIHKDEHMNSQQTMSFQLSSRGSPPKYESRRMLLQKQVNEENKQPPMLIQSEISYEHPRTIPQNFQTDSQKEIARLKLHIDELNILNEELVKSNINLKNTNEQKKTKLNQFIALIDRQAQEILSYKDQLSTIKEENALLSKEIRLLNEQINHDQNKINQTQDMGKRIKHQREAQKQEISLSQMKKPEAEQSLETKRANDAEQERSQDTIQLLNKTLKRIEEVQLDQVESNKQFMKCLLQIVEQKKDESKSTFVSHQHSDETRTKRGKSETDYIYQSPQFQVLKDVSNNHMKTEAKEPKLFPSKSIDLKKKTKTIKPTRRKTEKYRF